MRGAVDTAHIQAMSPAAHAKPWPDFELSVLLRSARLKEGANFFCRRDRLTFLSVLLTLTFRALFSLEHEDTPFLLLQKQYMRIR